MEGDTEAAAAVYTVLSGPYAVNAGIEQMQRSRGVCPSIDGLARQSCHARWRTHERLGLSGLPVVEIRRRLHSSDSGKFARAS